MRDNSKRFSAGADPAPAVADEAKPSLDFATPTELVDLPSKGRFIHQTIHYIIKKQLRLST